MSRTRDLGKIISGNVNMPTISVDSDFTVDTNTLYVDATNNRVGVGTAAPSGGRVVISQNNSIQPAIHLPEDESTIQGPGTDTQIRMGGNLTLQSSNVTNVIAKNAAGYIAHYTGSTPTERMRIDASGRVTMPYQPAFCARRNSNVSVTTNTKLSFVTNDVNNGNHWDGSKFTAPVAGNYVFLVNLRLACTGLLRVIVLDIYKNGSVFRQRAFGQGGGHDYDNSIGADHPYISGSIIMYLNANDYVELYTGSEITFTGNLEIQNSGDSSFFSGYLIG